MIITEWITPRPYIHLAKTVMGDIDLDPASSDVAQRNVEARHYFTPKEDGLKQRWYGRVWLNPPQGRGGTAPFMRKLIEHHRSGDVEEAIVLVPNSLDTKWAHDLMNETGLAVFKQGRISFESHERKSATPANGQVFFYLGNRPERFVEKFKPLGNACHLPPEWATPLRKAARWNSYQAEAA